MVQQAMQSVLELEMEECLQAGRYERPEERMGPRTGAGISARRFLSNISAVRRR
jgi:hypothetical protein